MSIATAYFRDHDSDLPIGGTPAPLPCPFCGSPDVCVMAEEDAEDEELVTAYCECIRCGAQAGWGCSLDVKPPMSKLQVIVTAAESWNTANLTAEPLPKL